MCDKKEQLLENLIKKSQKNTEILLELYFRTVNEDVEDLEILKVLSETSKNLTILNGIINYHIKSSNKHL